HVGRQEVRIVDHERLAGHRGVAREARAVDGNGELDERRLGLGIGLRQSEAQALLTLIARFDEVEAAGVGGSDAAGLREDQVEQGLHVALGAERDADTGELADLAAAARRFGPGPGGLRAAASRYPARTATSSCRVPTGWRTNPESSSAGISVGTSVSPLRPRATIAPPASMKARNTSSGNVERLSESSRKTVGRSSTARSRGRRAWRASIWARSSAGPTLVASHAEVCSSRYLMAWSSRARSPSRHEVLTRCSPCCASLYSGNTANAFWYISTALSRCPRS